MDYDYNKHDLENEAFVYDLLVEFTVATSDEIDLVVNINGWSIDTLNDILYARTAYHDIEQFLEAEGFTIDYNEEDDE